MESKIDKDPVLGGTLIEGVFEPTLFYEVLKDVPLQRENSMVKRPKQTLIKYSMYN